jgi:hypothetical protein
VAMKTLILMAMGTLALARPAQAETVYQFVALCNAEQLGHCFNRIDTRLLGLNASTNRRICLPATFGAMLSDVIPVSLLEQVRVRLSAARFGDSATDVDDVIVRIVDEIYPCDPSTVRRAARAAAP